MRAPLVLGVAWLAAGIAVGLQRPVPAGGGPLVVGLALLGVVTAALLSLGGGGVGSGTVGRAGAARGRTRLTMGLLLLSGVAMGTAARTDAVRSCQHWIPDSVPLELRGVLGPWQPGQDGASVRLRLDVRQVVVAGREVACRSELPARWDGPPPEAGAVVEARGRWWSPPGSRSLVRRPGTLLLDTLVATGRTERPPLGAALRATARARIDSTFQRRAPLVASLLLAQRSGLDPEVRERFARAGLSHLLAISGLHVGLVAGILLLLTGLLRAGKGRASALAAGGTVAYVLLLGAPHSAARAALQIVLVLAARAAQRPTRTEAVVAAAALLLLAVDPAALAQPGFQLSFAGVAGILALRRPLLRRLTRLRRHGGRAGKVGRWLADGLATSVAATLATAPFVAWHFGRVAPIGIAANLVAIPLLAAAVPALALALFAGWVWLPAGRFLAGTGELLLGLLDGTATVAAGLPFATVAVAPPSALLATAAVGAGYVLSRRLGRVRSTVRAGVWAGVCVVVLGLVPLRPAGGVELHVIDVGQGDAIALRSPRGRWVLMDAGVAGERYDAGARIVVPYLQRQGVLRLEALLLSHPDADHMGGAGAVMESLRPRWVGGPAVVTGKGMYLGLLERARDAGTPWVAVREGMDLDIDGMRVRVLWPGRSGLGMDDANDASVVVRVSYGEFAALLTGDASVEVEEHLVQRLGRRLDADVLKVGHHGSNTSTSVDLLRATGATAALISAGRGNRYGHPHGTVLARLRTAAVQVYRTDRQGTLVVRARADGRYRVETERGRSR